MLTVCLGCSEKSDVSVPGRISMCKWMTGALSNSTVHPAHVAWQFLFSLDFVIITAVYGFDLHDNPQQTLNRLSFGTMFSVFIVTTVYGRLYSDCYFGSCKGYFEPDRYTMHLCLLCWSYPVSVVFLHENLIMLALRVLSKDEESEKPSNRAGHDWRLPIAFQESAGLSVMTHGYCFYLHARLSN